MLQKYFLFDSWHVNSNFYCRLYKEDIINSVNLLKPNSVVEIGCGLGDIISRINCKKKTGYDIDLRVLKAATILNPNVVYKCGSFSDIQKTQTDVLIIFNWIHNISPVILKDLMLDVIPYFNYIVLDQIHDNQDGYKYSHDFIWMNEIFDIYQKLNKIGGENRNLIIYRKKTYEKN